VRPGTAQPDGSRPLCYRRLGRRSLHSKCRVKWWGWADSKGPWGRLIGKITEPPAAPKAAGGE